MDQYRYKNREAYFQAQITRSQKKSGYCKVFFLDVLRYRAVLEMDRQPIQLLQPILCLGVRSGAEVDIFRSVFQAPLMRIPFVQKWVVNQDKTKIAADKIRLARRTRWGWGSPQDGRVMGVEINPDISRPDVYVGSFDELPSEWEGRFKLIFTNSFDHSRDPDKTIKEWKRIAAPGAYLVIAFPKEHTPTDTDPLGHLTLDVVRGYVQSNIVFATETLNRNGYHEICFHLPG